MKRRQQTQLPSIMILTRYYRS